MGKREVDWGVMVRDTVQKLVRNIGKTRPTPICPFLYHLYRKEEILTAQEEEVYIAGVEFDKAGLVESGDEEEGDEGTARDGDDDDDTDEAEEDEEEDEEEEDYTGPDPDIMEISPPVQPAKVTKKVTAQDGRGASPHRGKGSRAPKEPAPKPVSRPTPQPVLKTPAGNPIPARQQHVDPMMNLVFALGYARESYNDMKGVMDLLCAEFMAENLDEVKAAIDRRPTTETVQGLQKRIAQLQIDNTWL